MGLPGPDAEDAAQEILLVFAKSYRSGNHDPGTGRLSRRRFGTAGRQVLNARRRRGPAQVRALGDDSSFWSRLPDEDEASCSWHLEWEQAVRQRCRAQVRRDVGAHTCQAFEFTVHRGRAADDAASELGIAKSTVYLAKHRVLKRIRELPKQFAEVM